MYFLYMSPPVGRILKSFPADLTNIRLQTVVHVEMSLQIFGTLKPFWAQCTFVRLLGVVHMHSDHMSAHVVVTVECLVTHLTLNGRGSVFGHVKVKSNFPLTNLVTNVAGKLFGMNTFNVTVQVFLAFKALAAVRA